MRLWRISEFADLSGEGGLLAPARWHSKGGRIVYTGDHPASCLVEMLVHFQIDAEDVPGSYQLIVIDIVPEIAFGAVELENLPSNWRQDRKTTQDIGDHWLGEARHALLRVPSAIVPRTFNWLLNPAHKDATAARIVDTIRTPLDPRFLQKG
jgi:RES domain-containing protein